MNEEEKLKKLLRKYSATSWYFFLDRILKSTDLIWVQKRKNIFYSISPATNIQEYFIAWMYQKIILYTRFSINNTQVIELIDARNALLMIGALFKSGHELLSPEGTLNSALFIARNAQAQYSVANTAFIQFHRVFLLFEIMPGLPEMRKYNEEHSFDLNQKFDEVFKVNVANYLKFCFMLFSIFLNDASNINKRGFIKSCERFISKEIDFELLLMQFSANNIVAEKHEEIFLPKNVKYKYNSIPLLKINPVLEIGDNNLELFAPFPHLIINKVVDLIYLKFRDKYKNNFTAWFGRLLEQYCGAVINETFLGAEIIPIESISYEGTKVDFIVLKDNVAILVECKAARIYRSLTESDDEKDQETFEHIKKAQNQISEFTASIKDERKGLEKFFGIKNFYGLIVTWEELAPIITDDDFLLKTLLKQNNLSFNDNIQFKVFSINRLEQLQASLAKSNNSVNKFISLYDGKFSDKWESLTNGIKTKDSFLDKNFTEWATSWLHN